MSEIAEPMATPAPKPTVVAAFDFDGTLTKRDTLRLFFIEWSGWGGLAKALLAEVLSVLAAAVLGRHYRDRARVALSTRLLAGHEEDRALETARRLADRIFLRELRKDTCAWLNWHRSQGHEVVIVSASFAPYVELVGRRLGANAVLATRWEVDGLARLTGGLVDRNVRGPEKASLLLSHLQGREAFIYAYGNSAGDRDLLRVADKSRWVRRYRRLPSPPDPRPPG